MIGKENQTNLRFSYGLRYYISLKISKGNTVKNKNKNKTKKQIKT